MPDTDRVIRSSGSSAPVGYRFPRGVIAVAVRWYLRYGLSYRDVEELLAERGIDVDQVTIYRWVQRSRRSSSTPLVQPDTQLVTAGLSTTLTSSCSPLDLCVSRGRPAPPGDRRDVSTRRDAAAARAFFARAQR